MKNWFVPALCFAAMTFSGCISDFREDDHVMTTPALMETVRVDSEISDDLRIIQTSKMRTEKGLEVVCIRARLKRDGFVSFVLSLQNTYDLSYKFTWFDAQGKEVKSDGQWYSMTLRPGAEFSCTSQSPAPGVVKVALTIRKGLAKKTVQTVPAVSAKKPAPAVKAVPAPVKKAVPAPKKVQSNTNCLCGCANGETCYCFEDSGCPNAKKQTK